MIERSCSTKSTSSKDPAAGSRRIRLHCYRFCHIVSTKIPTDAARSSGSTTPAISVLRAEIVSGNPPTSPVSPPGSAEFFEHCAPSGNGMPTILFGGGKYTRNIHHRARRHATAANPFFSTRRQELQRGAPAGRFSPRCHLLTKLLVTFK